MKFKMKSNSTKEEIVNRLNIVMNFKINSLS